MMGWWLFLQLFVLIILVGLVVQSVVSGIITHRTTQDIRFVERTSELRRQHGPDYVK